MASCKECIHFVVCDSGRHIGEYIKDDAVYSDGVEKECETFKDAADVVEVKHEKWTEVRVTGNGYGQVYYQHKNCTVNSTQLHTSPLEYCPRCGAKMDGRSENHERSVVLGTIEPLPVHHGTPSFSTKEAALKYFEQCRKEIEDER